MPLVGTLSLHLAHGQTYSHKPLRQCQDFLSFYGSTSYEPDHLLALTNSKSLARYDPRSVPPLLWTHSITLSSLVPGISRTISPSHSLWSGEWVIVRYFTKSPIFITAHNLEVCFCTKSGFTAIIDFYVRLAIAVVARPPHNNSRFLTLIQSLVPTGWRNSLEGRYN